MRSVALLFAVLVAATVVTGYGGGSDGTAEPAPFTIVTTFDSLTDPLSGTSNVEQGSDATGCWDGTLVDHPLAEGDFGTGQSGGVTLKVLTCTQGERSGSFLVHFEAAFERWRFHSGTGDFAGIKGQGHYF